MVPVGNVLTRGAVSVNAPRGCRQHPRNPQRPAVKSHPGHHQPRPTVRNEPHYCISYCLDIGQPFTVLELALIHHLVHRPCYLYKSDRQETCEQNESPARNRLGESPQSPRFSSQGKDYALSVLLLSRKDAVHSSAPTLRPALLVLPWYSFFVAKYRRSLSHSCHLPLKGVDICVLGILRTDDK